MFYLKYLKAELTRRWGKTISISLGLALASAIIIIIISISNALSTSQETVLNPLQNVGTDLMITKTVSEENIRNLNQDDHLEMMSQNRVSTDLSKLGNPGDDFSRDTFLPGAMLTFESNVMEKANKDSIDEYVNGLYLTINRQSGKIPNVTAEFETGGDEIEVNQQMTDSQRDEMRTAMEKAQEEVRISGLDPRSAEGQSAMNEALKKYAPNLSTKITTERKKYTQNVGSISTDISTESLSIAGIDTSNKNIGLIIPKNVVSGKYLENDDQVLVSKSYADTNSIKLEDKVKIGDKEFVVIGIVEPEFYTNQAEFYITLPALQKLFQKENKINIILVKSKDASQVEVSKEALKNVFEGAVVSGSEETAKQVSGSLISVANLTNKFIGLTSAIVVIASFVIVSLLTILSLNKRVREIGTLKAIGWDSSRIVRQLVLENIVLGILGALVGVAIAGMVIVLINNLDISLSANVSQAGGLQMMRHFNENASPKTVETVELKMMLSLTLVAIGAGVAILGSIFSGMLGAIRSTRLKPSLALRNLE